MKRSIAMWMLGAVLVGATGCGAHVSVVRQGAFSGEIAVNGPLVEAHYAAETAMLEHCQGRVQIVDASYGAALAVRDQQDPSKPSDAEATGEHIHYVCTSRVPHN